MDAAVIGHDEPARKTRYAAIYRKLAEGIRSGRYPVGGRLPTEAELCTAHGVSRHTVREAVRRLTDQGLIARQPGVGSIVLRRTRPGGFTQRISALQDLLAYVKTAQLEILEARDVSHLFRSSPAFVSFRRSSYLRKLELDFMALLSPTLTRRKVLASREAAASGGADELR